MFISSVLFFTVGWTIGANISGRLTNRMPETSLTMAGFFITAPALAGLWVAASTEAPLWLVFALLVAAARERRRLDDEAFQSLERVRTIIMTAALDAIVGVLGAASVVSQRAQRWTVLR